MVCPHYLSFILYNPVRKFFTDRERVLRESGVTPESTVLEVGSGNGFFTEVLAKAAKKVYAVELQDAMVRKLESRVRGYRDKVEIINHSISGFKPPEGVFDVAFVYFSFHEIDDQLKGAGHIASAVKPDGVLSIYEPTVEVSREKMDRTCEVFESLSFKTEIRRDGLLVRFLRMRKG